MNELFKNIPDNFLLPPPGVKSMKTLNRDAFSKTVSVPFVKVPLSEMRYAMKCLKPVLLKIPKFNPVLDNDNGVKNIVLNPLLLKTINKDILDCMTKFEFDNDSTWMELALNYENYTHKDLLKSVLPDDLGNGVAGFSIIGHLIHLNLKEAYKDYKSIIGQILMDTHPHVETIVNKIDIIESKFRNFEMEVLAGVPKFEVDVKENKYRFVFDFSKVFWNPRLSHEHGEICNKLKETDIVFDVFAGVGPFAIPAAAEKKCIVHANDLNPDSYKWLTHNAKLNKVNERVHSYNMDGKEFIQTIVKEELVKFWGKVFHIIMNLPGCALEFVDAFKNLLKSHHQDINLTETSCTPFVYCYFFAKENSDTSKTEVINKYLDDEMQRHIKEIKLVRLVAPNKYMFRLEFNLSTTVLFGNIQSNGNEHGCEPETKKIKLNA